MSNSQGIQVLLVTEKEVSKKILEARQERHQYIKEAKEVAKKEIEALRAKKDEEYKKVEKMYSEQREAIASEYLKYIDTVIVQSEKNYKNNCSVIVDKLVDVITDVIAKPHRNYKLAENFS